MDDIADFKLTDDAMTHMGLSDADKLAIYTIIAGVLHLGNVSFEDSHDDSTGMKDTVASANVFLRLDLWQQSVFLYFIILIPASEI